MIKHFGETTVRKAIIVSMDEMRPDAEATILVRLPLTLKGHRAEEVHKTIKSVFPDNKVLSIPDNVWIKECTIYELQQIRDMVSNIISEIESSKEK